LDSALATPWQAAAIMVAVAQVASFIFIGVSSLGFYPIWFP
jgi:hypothetical protein